MRSLWILRMNASCRMYGLPYNRMIRGLINANVKINRKVLADLAVTEPLSFRAAVEVAKGSLNGKTMTAQASAAS
jgi:large subunit ribosomal protein L20